MKIAAREKKTKTVVTRRKKETCKYFAKPNTKKIRRSCEIESNFGKGNLIKKIFFYKYNKHLQHVQK